MCFVVMYSGTGLKTAFYRSSMQFLCFRIHSILRLMSKWIILSMGRRHWIIIKVHMREV